MNSFGSNSLGIFQTQYCSLYGSQHNNQFRIGFYRAYVKQQFMIDIYILNFIEISKTYIKSYKKENFKEADRSRSFWVASLS
ncbi:conserved hypothetical protein [Leptospira interrogans serovar Manilae]|uniref:Uncharacterized protein n=1 Tax=Leptospira interrogans serovar Manilae TaxID=214675 RepID=A0AAQ1P457_LEPIR|nr:conserved hypothetical protein [Leptospira interrogans serovar Manilae]